MKRFTLPLFLGLITTISQAQESLKINEQGYFEMPGLNVTVFSDIYPDGHQTGVTIIQHGVRTVANGDLRLEPSPGQWSPVPKGGKLTISDNKITQELWYPDSSKNMRGFNPIQYPDLQLSYDVSVTALTGSSFKITVNLDSPIPDEWAGKIGFNIELFPGDLFGKTYKMDNKVGMFPLQANGPIGTHADQTLADPLAIGNKLTVALEEDLQRVTFESSAQPLELWDGRSNHNNGWYIVRSEIPTGKTNNALEWIVTPHVVKNWQYTPVIHVSQVGYHVNQKKTAIIELDKSTTDFTEVVISKATESGLEEIKRARPKKWGQFLRYQYATLEFSEVKEPGVYVVTYGNSTSNPFIISEDVFDRHIWQPTLEYYLPVQMCHMRVNDNYRVWHGLCHIDDALMAPVDSNHFDGYVQGPSTLTKYKPFDHVEGLDAGGWHDAGDYDLRVESQIGTIWKLALMIEEFGLNYDATMIDQQKNLVEIHVPDGKSDALQQIEHGLLSVLGGYRAFNRLYRGIICSQLRQYTLLGDASVMTDNLPYSPELKEGERKDGFSGILDDRLVFTENNPDRELYVVAGLAAASRVLKKSNPTLSKECLETAQALYEVAKSKGNTTEKIKALSELILATESKNYIKEFVSMKDEIIEKLAYCGWAVGHVIHKIDDKKFKKALSTAVADYQKELKKQEAEDSPFGVPYKPNIWGAGWSIQEFGVEQYFFYKGWPEHTTSEFFVNAFNFVLGVHPGENTSSFASGIGSQSVTVAYGINRVDWSFIPGGVASGTALIRPDLPELKIWPFFWQQTEYVMGGGATNYMFLAMAVQQLYSQK